MLIFLVPLALVVVGLILGGSLQHLTSLPVRALWLVPLAFGVQAVIVRLPEPSPSPSIGAALVGSYAVLAVFLLLNQHILGLRVMLFGVLLNGAVMVANGGFMPVSPGTLAGAGLERPDATLGNRVPMSRDILLPVERTRFPSFADVLTITWPLPQAFSAGDLFVATGVGILVLGGMQVKAGQIGRPTVRGEWHDALDEANVS